MLQKIQNELSSDNLIKLLCLILFIMVLVWGYSKIMYTNDGSSKLVQIDLIKINNDYLGKATKLVVAVDPNLSEQERSVKAQNIMKIVGGSLENLVDEYSQKNKVIIVQKQMIVSDKGNQIKDITNEIEAKIDSRINQKNLLDATK